MRTKTMADFVIALVVTASLAVACSSASPSASGGSAGAASSASSSAGAGSDVAALISATCTKCHPIERVKAARHDTAGWTTTITRMRQVRGVSIDDTQARAIIDFLASGGASKL